MNRALPKDPVVWVFMGLIFLSVPVLVFLGDQYAAQKRTVSAVPLSLTPMPSSKRLLELVWKGVSAGEDVTLKRIYTPEVEPANGVAALYNLERDGEILYRLVVFRDDIACSTCRDILAAVVYDARTDTIVQVFLLDPWEVKGEKVDTGAFLAQFTGKPAQTFFAFGKNLDGISGATYSTAGLVKRLNGVSVWMATQSPLTRPEIPSPDSSGGAVRP